MFYKDFIRAFDIHSYLLIVLWCFFGFFNLWQLLYNREKPLNVFERLNHIKITDEIYQVGGSGFSSPEDAAIYLIVQGGQTALVDAGCGRNLNKVISNIKECGIGSAQIDYLLITHCHFDHIGGAEAIKNKFQCKIITYELDAEFIEQGNDTITAANWYGSSLKTFYIDWKLTGSR